MVQAWKSNMHSHANPRWFIAASHPLDLGCIHQAAPFSPNSQPRAVDWLVAGALAGPFSPTTTSLGRDTDLGRTPLLSTGTSTLPHNVKYILGKINKH